MSDLFIQQAGHGPVPLVLLHGWAMHGGVFAPLVEALEARCTLYLVDLPGHGRSRDSSLPLAPAACAAAIAARTPPACWLGWSLGGLVALQAALDQPRQVRGLAMLASSPCFVRRADWPYGMPISVFEQFGQELGGRLAATMERFLALEAMGNARARSLLPAMREAVAAGGEPDPRVLPEGLAVLRDTDLRARLSELDLPNVWIAGARDRLIPWPAMQWSAARAGGLQRCIEHAGHAPFIGFVEQVVEALEPLLKSQTSLRKHA